MKFLLITALILVFTLTTAAQQNASTPLTQRANELIGVINEPRDLDKYFAPSFLAAVSPDKWKAVSDQITGAYGKALKVEKVAPVNDYAGEISVLFEKNFILRINLTIDDKAPFLVTGLLTVGGEKTSNSFDDIIGELKKLPGQTALTVAKLDGKNVQPLVSYNNEKPLAVGSSFKLYVLSELVRSITANERKWSDVVELNEFSLPSGMMQDWGKGSSVTLQTLASMMISVSDNTATDQLITTLGRDKIEHMMTVTENSNPNLSFPFLKTVEMFKLKELKNKTLAETYLSKDANGKRAMLGNEIAAFKKEDIDLDTFLKKPTYISQIEWFASTDDLARVMNWLRTNSETPAAKKARDVLTINKALSPEDAKNWKYIGYKGGSETGVMAMTFLLQSQKGEWFVVSSAWNDENAAVDQNNFALLVQKTVKLLQEKTQ